MSKRKMSMDFSTPGTENKKAKAAQNLNVGLGGTVFEPEKTYAKHFRGKHLFGEKQDQPSNNVYMIVKPAEGLDAELQASLKAAVPVDCEIKNADNMAGGKGCKIKITSDKVYDMVVNILEDFNLDKACKAAFNSSIMDDIPKPKLHYRLEGNQVRIPRCGSCGPRLASYQTNCPHHACMPPLRRL